MTELFSDADLRFIHVLVWLYFPLSLVMAFFGGVIPAYGAKGGGPGFGHLCWRKEDPSTFNQAVALHLFVTFVVPVLYVLNSNSST